MIPGRLAQACLWFFIMLVMLGGPALWVVSFIPYDTDKTKVDSFATDQNAAPFTAAFFRQIIFKLRLAGSVISLTGVLGLIFRRTLQQHLNQLFYADAELRRTLARQMIRTLVKENKLHLAVLLFIILLAVTLRIHFLFQPIRNDEAYTFITYSSKPFYMILTTYCNVNNHIFHTLLVRISYLLFGSDPWALRMPALLAGILTAPLVYLACRTIYNRHAALIAAALAASSSTLIEYSTNARGYTLICCFFLLIWSLGGYLLHQQNRAGWVWWAFMAALGFYTNPVMLYPFGMVFIWLLLTIIFHNTDQPRRPRINDLILGIILTVIFTLILHLPVVLVTGFHPIETDSALISLGLAEFFEKVPTALAGQWRQWNRDVPLPLDILLIAGVVISLIPSRQTPAQRIPMLYVVIIWIIPILMIQRLIPYTRVWLFLLPLFFILTGAGLSRIIFSLTSKTPKALLIIISLLSILLTSWFGFNVYRSQSVYYSEEGAYRSAEDIALFLRDRLQPGDTIATRINAAPLHYYFMTYNIPIAPLITDATQGDRVWIVVNVAPRETLAVILEAHQIPPADFTEPILIKEFESAEMYQIQKKH